MSKIIINIDDGISDEIAMQHIYATVQQGKISNDETQYCYVTVYPALYKFGNEILPIAVYAEKLKSGTFVFRVAIDRQQRNKNILDDTECLKDEKPSQIASIEQGTDNLVEYIQQTFGWKLDDWQIGIFHALITYGKIKVFWTRGDIKKGDRSWDSANIASIEQRVSNLVKLADQIFGENPNSLKEKFSELAVKQYKQGFDDGVKTISKCLISYMTKRGGFPADVRNEILDLLSSLDIGVDEK